jgi:hypothetical protein
MEEGNRVLLDEMEDEVVGEALNRFLKSVGMEEGKQREMMVLIPRFISCYRP